MGYTSAGGQVTRQDDYFNLSGVTYSTSLYIGTQNTNFYTTEFDYNPRGLLKKTKLPTGTLEWSVYDGLKRPISSWVGTNDTGATNSDPTGGGASGNNMVKVAEYQYDNGDVGDGNLTKVTQIPGGSAANRVTENYFDWRDRRVASKSGVQASEATDVNRPITYLDYDNLGQVIKTRQYDGDGVTITFTSGVPNAPSSSLLRAQSESAFDEQGRVYQAKVYSVNPSSGSVSHALTTNNYFDHRGQLFATSAPGGLWTKQKFDGAGRPTITYTTDGATGTTWSNAGSVSNDTVLEQNEYTYDSNGNVIKTILRQRFNDASATGALVDPSTDPKARVYYGGMYYDAVNRLTATVNVGTNGGSSWTRPSSVPSRSDTVLVTSYAFNAAGWVSSETDPRAIVSQISYDALGRVTQTAAAYTDGTPSDEDDQITQYTYDGSGHTLKVKAVLPSSGQQETEFVYAATTAAGSAVNSNDLLGAVKHPDPSTGAGSSSHKDSFTVNALGQVSTGTDRNGSVHTYSYDVLGRLTSDAITTLASGVDGAVRRIETAYDTAGNAYLFTSYNAASSGSVVNQVQRVYNGLGQLTAEYQAHAGAVNTGTTPKVQYEFTEMNGGSSNHSRLLNVVYPNGRTIAFTSRDEEGVDLDDRISRLSWISDVSTGTLESYTYLGLDTVVVLGREDGLSLSYRKLTGEADGDAGDQYTGLDRFGRIVDQRWMISTTNYDRIQYGYDRNGNRLYAENLIDAAFSELYDYNDLNELTSFQRGTLNSTKDGLTGSASRSQSWNLDALGNWESVTTDSNTQNRTHNSQNQVTGVGSDTLAYAANGNLSIDANDNEYEYDAWNRLVRITNIDPEITYAYDALGRPIIEDAGTARDLYYSASWQVLEERVASGGTSVPRVQYVWSPTGIDTLVARDRDTDADGKLEQRIYVAQDPNGNVTSLVGNGVGERYIYDPYGAVSVLTPSWGSRSSSSYDWNYLFQGKRREVAVGLDDSRMRVYSPMLGRWLQQDPIGFGGGDINLYRFVGDNPTNGIDPIGLDRFWISDPIQAGRDIWNGFVGSRPPSRNPGPRPRPPQLDRPRGPRNPGTAPRGPVGAPGSHGGSPSLGGTTIDLFTGLMPLGSDVRDIAEFGLGRDIVTGEPLTGSQRGVALVVAILPIVSGSIVRRGGTYLLRDPATEQVMRTGRSGNLDARRSRHAHDYPDLRFEEVHRTDLYAEQRGLEQLLHEAHNPPMNKINPIDPKNPNRQEYLDAAQQCLRRQQGGN